MHIELWLSEIQSDIQWVFDLEGKLCLFASKCLQAFAGNPNGESKPEKLFVSNSDFKILGKKRLGFDLLREAWALNLLKFIKVPPFQVSVTLPLATAKEMLINEA